MFYVYYLKNSLTNEVFYVGKGSCNSRNSRKTDHVYDAKRLPHLQENRLKCYIINTILKQGGKVIATIGEQFETEEDALLYEAQEITRLGKIIEGTGCLSNIQDGGTQPPKQPNKTVYAYNEVGEIIDKFDNTFLAAKTLQVTPSVIHNCCAGRSKWCKGVILSYDSSLPTSELIRRNTSGKIKKQKIYKLDDNKNILCVYDSLTSAGNGVGVDARRIILSIKKGHRCMGFYWRR